MDRTGQRLLHWAPRALGIAYALFISIFALDVFAANLPFGKLLIALAIHLFPTLIVVVVLAFAWKHEWVGMVGFVALGVLYLSITGLQFPLVVYLIIAGPAFLIGLLFLADWLLRRGPQPSA